MVPIVLLLFGVAFLSSINIVKECINLEKMIGELGLPKRDKEEKRQEE